MLIEFTGLPRSGKSTQIDILRDYFTRKGMSVVVIGEAAKRCPFDKKNRIEVACWMANNALNSILEAQLGGKSNTIYLQDRGLFDAIAFFYLLYHEHFINESEFKNLLNYYAIERWFNYVDLAIYFDIQPNLAISRDVARHLLYEDYQSSLPEGLITSSHRLMMLRAAYAEFQADYSSLLYKKLVMQEIHPDFSLGVISRSILKSVNEMR